MWFHRHPGPTSRCLANPSGCPVWHRRARATQSAPTRVCKASPGVLSRAARTRDSVERAGDGRGRSANAFRGGSAQTAALMRADLSNDRSFSHPWRHLCWSLRPFPSSGSALCRVGAGRPLAESFVPLSRKPCLHVCAHAALPFAWVPGFSVSGPHQHPHISLLFALQLRRHASSHSARVSPSLSGLLLPSVPAIGSAAAMTAARCVSFCLPHHAGIALCCGDPAGATERRSRVLQRF